MFSSESFVSRIEIWNTLKVYILQSPVRLILGYGIGSFNYLFDFSSHNLFFELIIEGGIINALYFILLIIYVIYKLTKNFNKNKVPIISLISSIPIFFTIGSFLDFWLFWIILGICFARL